MFVTEITGFKPLFNSTIMIKCLLETLPVLGKLYLFIQYVQSIKMVISKFYTTFENAERAGSPKGHSDIKNMESTSLDINNMSFMREDTLLFRKE